MKIKTTILALLLTFSVEAQVQLLSVKPSQCSHSCEMTKRIYEQTWLSDSTLQIKTTASANCIGVHNPRLKTYGPILSLEFDEFKSDTAINPLTYKRGEPIAADCNCVYEIFWKIKGLNIKDAFILLLNGQLESDYKKTNIDNLLDSYQIETYNSTYAFLRNAIDKHGLRQGIQIFTENKESKFRLFIDGKEQTNR